MYCAAAKALSAFMCACWNAGAVALGVFAAVEVFFDGKIPPAAGLEVLPGLSSLDKDRGALLWDADCGASAGAVVLPSAGCGVDVGTGVGDRVSLRRVGVGDGEG